MRMTISMLERRRFLKTAGMITAGIVCLQRETEGQDADKEPVTIKDLRITQGVTIEADDGTEGGRRALEMQMTQSPEGEMLYIMPKKPGIS